VRWLASVLPECFEGLRWEQEREDFERWLVEALGNPIAHFERWEVASNEAEPWSLNSFYWDPPETLRDLAAAFEIQVDPPTFERAYEEVQKGFEEEVSWIERSAALSPSRTPQAAGLASQRVRRRDEGNVAALFERFEEVE
jgi:hypothetical protein